MVLCPLAVARIQMEKTTRVWMVEHRFVINFILYSLCFILESTESERQSAGWLQLRRKSTVKIWSCLQIIICIQFGYVIDIPCPVMVTWQP
jgi:hypothetical protein